MSGVFDQGSISDFGEAEVLKTMLMPSLCTSPMNWISRDVAFHMEVHAKLDLAMHYVSKLLREHPSWLDTVSLADVSKPSEYENQQYKIQLKSFQQKLMAGLEYLENKFSLIPCHVINRVNSFVFPFRHL